MPPIALPGFVDHLPEACEGHQMGFYFEEGGCWGMALALADTLRNPVTWVDVPGVSPDHLPPVTLRVRSDDFVHAFVTVGNLMVDHRGAWDAKDETFSHACTETELRGWAVHFGVTDDDLDADRSSAQAVIETAMLWDVSAPEASPQPVVVPLPTA